jgi:hypothetical protein
VWKGIEKTKKRLSGARRCGHEPVVVAAAPSDAPPEGSLSCVLLLPSRSSPPGAGHCSPGDELAAGSGLLLPRGAHRRERAAASHGSWPPGAPTPLRLHPWRWDLESRRRKRKGEREGPGAEKRQRAHPCVLLMTAERWFHRP